MKTKIKKATLLKIGIGIFAVGLGIGIIMLVNMSIENRLDNIESDIYSKQLVYDELSTADVRVSINNYPLAMNMLYQKQILSADTLNTEYDAIIENKSPDKNIKIYINDMELNDSMNVKTEKLSKNEYIDLRIVKGNCERQYQISTLPEGFFNTELSGHSDIKGDYYSNYLNDDGESYIYKMDNDGNIVYYFKGNYKKAGSVMNFNKHVIGGKTRYSFFEPEVSNKLTVNGINYGHIIIMNEKYERIDKIGIKESEQIPQGDLAENHEFLYLGENHYMITGAINKTVQTGDGKQTRVKAAYIQEVKKGKVVFEWDSTSDSTLLEESKEGNDYSNHSSSFADYAHINCLDVAPDRNIIASLRNLDCIVKINHSTGKVMWKLGGKGDDFNLSTREMFSRQHYAKYQNDGTILMFDNGNLKQQTRILRFKLDEVNKKLISCDVYIQEDMYSSACGSVQQLNDDTYLIGWGYRGHDVVATEVNFKTGKVSCEIIGPKSVQTYKTLKFE